MADDGAPTQRADRASGQYSSAAVSTSAGGQPAPTHLQKSNRGECAHLLRDLDATADLPPHCPLLALQLLDRTHRWWSEREPDTEEGVVYTLAAAAFFCIKLHSARYPDPAPFQLPDPRQPASSLTHFLTAPAATLRRRQPRDVPPLHTAQAVHEVVAEEYRILVHAGRLGASAFPRVLSIFGSASHRELAHCSHCSRVFPRGISQAWPCVWQVTLSETAHSTRSPRKVALEAQPGSSRALSGSAFCCQALAEGDASLARSAPSTRVLLLFLRLLSLAFCQGV